MSPWGSKSMDTAFTSIMNNVWGGLMNSTDITVAVIGMNDREVDDLIELLTTEEMNITRPPRSGLLMMTVKDSFDADFHLGEVLVTEAAVSMGGSEGFGMVSGE